MYMTILMLILLSLSAMTPLTSSIITMGGFLIMSALISTFLTSFLVGSWFGFILFLIYITGLLVLFSYMMAMSPNNFNSKTSSAKKALTLTTLIIVMMLMKNINQLTPIKSSNNFEESVTQMYSNMNLIPYWLMAIILLMALLMSVNMCYKAPKPLRSFLE